MTLTPEQIAELRRLNTERTRDLGAWEYAPAKRGEITTIFGRYQSGEAAGIAYTDNDNGGVDQQNTDAAFIAAIANAADALLSAAEENARLREALNERDLFINPHLLEQAANEIDCGAQCERLWHEYDVNASGCYASERGEFCANDVAETLRALAKVSRAALEPSHD